MRLNAFLARAGVASRRRADELIKAGRVTVNGAPGQLNTVVAKNDRVAVDGKEVARQRPTLVWQDSLCATDFGGTSATNFAPDHSRWTGRRVCHCRSRHRQRFSLGRLARVR